MENELYVFCAQVIIRILTKPHRHHCPSRYRGVLDHRFLLLATLPGEGQRRTQRHQIFMDTTADHEAQSVEEGEWQVRSYDDHRIRQLVCLPYLDILVSGLPFLQYQIQLEPDTHLSQLYYQQYLHLHVIDTVVRFLPMFVSGVLCNVLVGTMAARIPVVYLAGESLTVKPLRTRLIHSF
jgi:hypothetical protein